MILYPEPPREARVQAVNTQPLWISPAGNPYVYRVTVPGLPAQAVLLIHRVVLRLPFVLDDGIVVLSAAVQSGPNPQLSDTERVLWSESVVAQAGLAAVSLNPSEPLYVEPFEVVRVGFEASTQASLPAPPITVSLGYREVKG